MANLTPAPTWDDVFQLETTTQVLGGPGGPANTQAQNLVNRFAYIESALGTLRIGTQLPDVGAIVRTQAQKNQDVGRYAEDFKQVGDPDDTLSIQRILNLGLTCYLRANKTYTAFNLTAVTNSGIVCIGGRALIVVPAGASRQALTILVSNFVWEGVNINGGDLADYKAGAGTIGTRCGMIIGSPEGTGINFSGIDVRNCDIYGFDRAGILGREVQFDAVNFGKRVTLTNVNAYRNRTGIHYSPRFEYILSTSCYAYDCYSGLWVQGGNNTFAACQSNWNNRNFELTSGYNDSHGQAVGCSFNHSFGGYSIYAKDVAYGFTFTNCALWFGTLELDNSVGISIRNSQVVSTVINIKGGGLNSIDDNFFQDVTRAYTGNCFTTFNRNRLTNITTDLQWVYGDLFMECRASTQLTVLFTALVHTQVAVTYGTKKWQGLDLAGLTVGQFAVIQKTGMVQSSAAITFTTAGAGQTVTMSLTKYDVTGTIVLDRRSRSLECDPASVGLTIELCIPGWMFTIGQLISFELQTTSALGFTPTAIEIVHRLVN